MGFALILAGLGATTVGVEKYKPGWTEDWHSPFIDVICRRAPEDFAEFDPTPLRRCQAQNGFDPSCIAHRQTCMEDFAANASERLDITCSQAALEQVGSPKAVLDNLYLATEPGGWGVHAIDFRDHRDFAPPSNSCCSTRMVSRPRSKAEILSGSAILSGSRHGCDSGATPGSVTPNMSSML